MVQVDSDTYLAFAGDYAYTFTISSNGSSITQVATWVIDDPLEEIVNV